MTSSTPKPVARMQKVFEFVLANPSVAATDVSKKLKMTNANVSSLLSQLDSRKMVTSESLAKVVKTKNGDRQSWVKHYTAAIPVYELLPEPKAPVKKIKIAQPAPTVPPVEVLPAVVKQPAGKQAAVAHVSPAAVDDFVDRLAIRDARVLYARLHRMFGE